MGYSYLDCIDFCFFQIIIPKSISPSRPIVTSQRFLTSKKSSLCEPYTGLTLTPNIVMTAGKLGSHVQIVCRINQLNSQYYLMINLPTITFSNPLTLTI